MRLFDKFKAKITEDSVLSKPIFVKEFTKENLNLKEMVKLSYANPNNKYLKKDILLLRQGITGEEKVAYELTNSFIDMFILYDLRIEYEGYIAQLDFVLITTHYIYVLETKHLNGDIRINSEGDFVRIIKDSTGKILKEEGMYNPSVQNKRHIQILSIFLKEKFGYSFPIKSFIVMSNPKTILNKELAPIEIKKEICRCDQLINRIQISEKLINTNMSYSKDDMYSISLYLLRHNTEMVFNLKSKYRIKTTKKNTYVKNSSINISSTSSSFKVTKQVNSSSFKSNALEIKSKLIAENLKEYRMKISKNEHIKPYMIFTNEMLTDFIRVKPKNEVELLGIRGFGKKKFEKYGTEIIRIINNSES